LHGFRRWAGNLRYHDRRRHRGRCCPDHRGEIPAAALAACRALVTAGFGDHAAAAAVDEVALDRAAVPPQGRGRPPDRSRSEMSGRRLGFGLFTLAMLALLVGLGVWQLQRRVAKHELIAALNERLAAHPVTLPAARE